MKKKFLAALICVVISNLFVTLQPMAKVCTPVTMVGKETHYEVVLDYTTGISHYKMGAQYGKKILEKIPDYEALCDSYISELIGNEKVYQAFLSRVEDIKPQIKQEYIDEIEGLASQLSGGKENVMGDNKISVDECFIFNLFPDIARGTQCSALSVFGKRSATNKTMSARILDWNSGSQNQIAKMQAVVTIKNGRKSICTIGYVGFMGVISGLNDDRIFAAILDSPTGMTYSSDSRSSYVMDIRYALENYKKLDQVSGYLKSSDRNYTYSHLVFISDSKTSVVLENNISTGSNCLRDIRTAKSVLNDGVKWDIKDSIGTVNAFMLKGNFDNYTGKEYNITRWDSMKSQLLSKGSKVTLSELKEVAAYHKGNTPGPIQEGNLYNQRTQQIIIFAPDNMYLEVFFRPVSGVLPDVPTFERIRTGL